MKTIILDEAYRKITLNEGDRKINIPMVQAIIRSLAVAAVKGQHRAQRVFTELVATVEGDNKRLHDEMLKTTIEYKLWWERELAQRVKEGRTGPEPIPHPDDIIIDMTTGQVHFNGPRTGEEKAVIDQLRARKTECDKTIAAFEKVLMGRPNSPRNEKLLSCLEEERELRAKIARVIPD